MTKRLINNPLTEDFSVPYDIYGKNPRKISIKAGEIKEFPKHEADHLQRHLANRMLNDDWPTDGNVEGRLKEINQLIEV